MIRETYATLACWDLGVSKRENLNRLREENFIGARSATWLRDIAKVINRRLEPNGRDRALVTLAQGGCAIDEWKPIFLWHLSRDELLVRDFFVNWIFHEYNDGAYHLRLDDVRHYLGTLGLRGGKTEHQWTDVTTSRVAGGLLKMAADFGLLRGGMIKEFAGYRLPERSLLYLLHAVLEQENRSPRRMMDSPEWQMFLMRPADLESAILRLHQFRSVDYQVAGSLVQLSLPYLHAVDYAESMIA